MKLLDKLARKFKKVISYMLIPQGTTALRGVSLNDLKLLVKANEDVGRILYFDGRFEPDETEFFKANLLESDICFDIGANVGYFSVVMAKLVGNGKVYAFEPIPMNANILRFNSEWNRLKNIELVQMALSDAVGMGEFSVSKDSAYSSLRNMNRSPESEKIQVDIISIDAFCERFCVKRIDAMKIDVEGAEELVLRGAKRLLEDKAKRPRFIMVELFEPSLKKYGSSINSVRNYLAEFQYSPFVIETGGKSLASFDSIRHKNEYNILFKGQREQ